MGVLVLVFLLLHIWWLNFPRMQFQMPDKWRISITFAFYNSDFFLYSFDSRRLKYSRYRKLPSVCTFRCTIPWKFRRKMHVHHEMLVAGKLIKFTVCFTTHTKKKPNEFFVSGASIEFFVAFPNVYTLFPNFMSAWVCQYVCVCVILSVHH